MLYQTLLNQIGSFIDRKPANPGSQTVVGLAKASNQTVEAYLAGFDIRAIGSLRTIIPDAFPQVLRTCPLVGELNIHGAWRVVPMLKSRRAFGSEANSSIL